LSYCSLAEQWLGLLYREFNCCAISFHFFFAGRPSPFCHFHIIFSQQTFSLLTLHIIVDEHLSACRQAAIRLRVIYHCTHAPPHSSLTHQTHIPSFLVIVKNRSLRDLPDQNLTPHT
jgi:hypothetical protein